MPNPVKMLKQLCLITGVIAFIFGIFQLYEGFQGHTKMFYSGSAGAIYGLLVAVLLYIERGKK